MSQHRTSTHSDDYYDVMILCASAVSVKNISVRHKEARGLLVDAMQVASKGHHWLTLAVLKTPPNFFG